MNLKYSIRITDPAREILHEQLKNDPDFNLVINLDYDIIAKKFMILTTTESSDNLTKRNADPNIGTLYLTKNSDYLTDHYGSETP